jgi:hypothetical protein
MGTATSVARAEQALLLFGLEAAARLRFVRLHAGLTILAKLAAALAVEVALWRCVQQTNPGRTPLDTFRVALSRLASLV